MITGGLSRVCVCSEGHLVTLEFLMWCESRQDFEGMWLVLVQGFVDIRGVHKSRNKSRSSICIIEELLFIYLFWEEGHLYSTC